MPIFEYECKKCGSVFEKLVKNRSEKVVCDHCGKSGVEKKLSVFAAHMGGPSKSCPSAESCKSRGSCPSGGCCPSMM